MKRLLVLLLVFISGSVFAQKVERVNPIYGSDEQANKMIAYISENLKMVVPIGRSLAEVNGYMRCRIAIDPHGKISEIKIINSLQMWLDIVIIEALKSIPPSPNWTSNTTHELKKALVFSFGNVQMAKATYGYDKQRVDNQVEASVNEQRTKQQEELASHWNAWGEKSKSDLKIKMPLSPERGKGPVIPLKDQQTPPPVNIPKVSVSLE